MCVWHVHVPKPWLLKMKASDTCTHMTFASDLHFHSKFLANLQFITTNKTINWYNWLSSFILWAVQIFARRILTSLSADETLLPSYMNFSTNFRGQSFRLEMAPSRLKHMHSILFAFIWRPVSSAACSRLCSRDSAWVCAFPRNTMSSA